MQWKDFLKEHEEPLKKSRFLLNYNINYINQTMEIPYDVLSELYNLQILKDNKIRKKLGNGAFGTAFLFENDHVFKIARIEDSNEPKNSNDLKIYSHYYEHPSDVFIVYELGRLSRRFFYVEMNRAYTLKEYLNMTGRESDYKLSTAISDLFIGLYVVLREWGNKNINIGDIIKTILKKVDTMLVTQYFSKSEIISLSIAWFEFVQKHNLWGNDDVHGNNIGVVPTFPSGKNMKFMIFDF